MKRNLAYDFIGVLMKIKSCLQTYPLMEYRHVLGGTLDFYGDGWWGSVLGLRGRRLIVSN